MLEPRARSAILAEIEPASWREHDFRSCGGSQKASEDPPQTELAPRASRKALGFCLAPILASDFDPEIVLESHWKTIEKMRFSSPGRDEFGLRAEWSGGVRAVRKSLLLAYQAWSRTRAQRSASQTRPSHRKRWSADLIASRIPPGQGSKTMWENCCPTCVGNGLPGA